MTDANSRTSLAIRNQTAAESFQGAVRTPNTPFLRTQEKT
jgi:hypothetical protein